MIGSLYTIKRKIFRNYVFSGARFIKGFSKNLTIEKEFLERLDLKGKTVYDIGCAAGIFTMFFSRSVGKNGRVIAFEPVPENYETALGNLKSQKLSNVELYNIGLGIRRERRSIAIRSYETATASMDKDTYGIITSEHGSRTLNVEVDSLDNIIEVKNLPFPDFVKIDAEGMELDVLSGMRSLMAASRPQLSIEVHGASNDKKMENIKKICGLLSSMGYEILHIETKTNITDKNYPVAKEGHIYCK